MPACRQSGAGPPCWRLPLPIDWPGEGRFDLVVFGGSQGARIMADIVPPAIQQLTPAERARLFITQQARARGSCPGQRDL